MLIDVVAMHVVASARRKLVGMNKFVFRKKNVYFLKCEISAALPHSSLVSELIPSPPLHRHHPL
jgi:hypothetical protein